MIRGEVAILNMVVTAGLVEQAILGPSEGMRKLKNKPCGYLRQKE